MHPADAKISPTKGVKTGSVVIHPHTMEVYIFDGSNWQPASEKKDEKRVQDDAYERAMRGI